MEYDDVVVNCHFSSLWVERKKIWMEWLNGFSVINIFSSFKELEHLFHPNKPILTLTSTPNPPPFIVEVRTFPWSEKYSQTSKAHFINMKHLRLTGTPNGLLPGLEIKRNLLCYFPKEMTILLRDESLESLVVDGGTWRECSDMRKERWSRCNIEGESIWRESLHLLRQSKTENASDTLFIYIMIQILYSLYFIRYLY